MHLAHEPGGLQVGPTFFSVDKLGGAFWKEREREKPIGEIFLTLEIREERKEGGGVAIVSATCALSSDCRFESHRLRSSICELASC